MEKIKVKALEWLHSKDPMFNAGETRTAKATVTNNTDQTITCTTELYLDVTKVATSGVSSSFTLQPGGSIDVSYVASMSKVGGPWHVYVDVSSGTTLLAHYQATEDVTVNPALSITTTSLPNGIVGAAYSQTLVAAGGSGSYSWSIASGSLPPGLSLSSAGVISGTPTTAGTYTFTVQVSDGIGTVTQSLSITIGVALSISTTSLPNGYLNIAYSQTLVAAGGSGSYSWSIASGSLPPGLSLSLAGVISGTPTTAGTYTFTVQVSDGISTKTQSLSITITSAIGIGPITWA